MLSRLQAKLENRWGMLLVNFYALLLQLRCFNSSSIRLDRKYDCPLNSEQVGRVTTVVKLVSTPTYTNKLSETAL